MRLRLLTSTIAFALFGFVACGQTSETADDDEGAVTDPTSAEGKDAACAATCDALAACDAELDKASCVEDCVADESISRAGQEALAKCLADAGCGAGENEGVAALACILGELADVPPSPEGSAFCEESLPRLSECAAEGAPAGEGGAGPVPAPTPTLPDADTCKLSVSLAADELLTGLNNCMAPDKSCQSVQLCAAIQLAPYIDLSGGEPTAGSAGLLDILGALFGGSFPGAPGDAPSDDGSAPPNP